MVQKRKGAQPRVSISPRLSMSTRASQAGTGEALPVTVSTPKAMPEPSKEEQAEDSDYTSESTEEVPALQGTPLSTGARMWTPSQFPQTLKLIKDLRTGELLPVEAQLTKLGYGRTRAAYALPAEVHQGFPRDSVLKLCVLRQHRGKEHEWGLHTSLVAPTYHQGQISVDFGVEARYVHYSVQQRATMATAWVAQYGGNVPLTHDFALYLLSSLFALELRGAVLVGVGPSNMMITASTPYPQVLLGDTAGWDTNQRIEHRGLGGFENIFRDFPSIQEEIQQIIMEAKQKGLKEVFQAANGCGRFGAYLVSQGSATLTPNSLTLQAADLPPFPPDLKWTQIPE